MAASSPSQWLWPSSSEMLPHSYQSLMMMPYSDDTSTNNQLFFNTTNSYYYDWSDITETQNDTLAPPNKLEDFMGTHSTSSTSPSLVGYTPNNSLQNTSNQSYLTGSDFIASNNKELLMFNHTHTSPVQALPLRMTQVAQGGKKMITSSTTTADNTATFGHRTSVYRGVTRHRWTGRYEAHLWDNTYRREGQTRKGRQVYLGGYDKEQKAARAYDLAALKYWGPTATTNFAISNYTKELEEMENMTKQEFIASLRRKSSGFSRGASVYRGVTRHHQQGRWQARIGRVSGNKDLYLGTFGTEEEAAEAYDIAAIKFRGLNAVTNFEMSRYNVETIANSSLPIGGGGPKRLKLSLEVEPAAARLLLDHDQKQPESASSTSTIVAVSPGVDGYVDVSYQNPGSTSGSSSDSTCSTAIAGPVMVVPPLEFCSRNLYGFANPAVNFNNNPTANINCQPWSLTSSSH